jgi:hypothetical protein
MGHRVVLSLTIYNEDGTVFDSFVKDSPDVDRRGVHAVQRAQLGALHELLDIADKVLAEKAAAASK